MDKAQILERIKEVVEDTAGIPQQKIKVDQSMMDELDLSSLEIMMIVAALEDAFGVRIPDSELRGFVTLTDVAAYLAAQGV